MALFRGVIDTDCLFFLLTSKVGNKILKNCEILLPSSIINELDQKQQNKLKTYNLSIVELDENDKNYAANIIQKISGKKENRNWYLEGRYLRKVKNIGECEGAAISKKLNVNIVLLDKKATSIIKKTFKFLNIKSIRLEDFGINILTQLGANKEIQIYKDELKERFQIFLDKN